MSNNTKIPTVEQLRFQLAVNLHYGAINLLNQSFDLLSKLGFVSKSEIVRFHKFVQFYQNLLVRGSKKIYPNNDSSNSSPETPSV